VREGVRDRSVRERLLQVRVVLGAPLLHRQHVVRERQAREDRLDLRLEGAQVLAEVAVRVELRRELVVGALDLLLVRPLRHPEQLVVRHVVEPRVEVEDAAPLLHLQIDLLRELGRVVAVEGGRDERRGRHTRPWGRVMGRLIHRRRPPLAENGRRDRA